MLHRRSSSVGCSRSLARLLATCDDILQRQQHAQQMVEAYEGGNVPLPLFEPAAATQHNAPALDMDVVRNVPLPESPECVSVTVPAALPESDDEEAMDTLGRPRKRGHDCDSAEVGTCTDEDGDSLPEEGEAAMLVSSSQTAAVAASKGAGRPPRKMQALPRQGEATSPPDVTDGPPSADPLLLAAANRPNARHDAPGCSGGLPLAPTGARGATIAGAAPQLAALAAAAAKEAQDGRAQPADPAATAGGRRNTGNAARPLPSTPPPPEAAGNKAANPWTTKLSRNARRRALRGAAVQPTSRAIAGTALFRPADRAASYLAAPREAIARQLSATEGVVEVRVNTRRNIVAADAATEECLKALMGLTQICGVPVHARLPADHNTSRGIIFGVDPNLTPEDIMGGIESEVPITAIERRQDRGVLVKFAGPAPPAYVCLWKLRLGVHACRPRPLQCTKCGRLDHATACCRGPARCARCGGSHPVDKCPAAAPRCTNCGGRHFVTDPRCPRWQQERQVATAVARSAQPVSRLEVQATIRAEADQSRSYAAVIKQQRRPKGQEEQRRPGGQTRTPTGSQQPIADPRSSTIPPAAQPAPSQDPTARVLLMAMQAMLNDLPADSPARPIATAILAAHQATVTNHHG